MDSLTNLIKIQLIWPGGGNKVELMVNDLSFESQFTNVPAFMDAMTRLMQMREVARKFGHDLHCHRNVAHSRVTQDLMMQQAIQYFGQDEKRSIMQWLTRHGPFWEDVRAHSPNDYLDCNGEIVTDTAVGEAAYRSVYEEEYRLVSLTPSSWQYSPISVTWTPDEGAKKNIDVFNHWAFDELEATLRSAPAPIESWPQLSNYSRIRFVNLTFSKDAFEYLDGHPFVKGAASQILRLLDTLDRLKCCFDENGERTAEGQKIYQDHFTGEKSWFSDSSDREKQHFKKELTFQHPNTDGESQFCTWHGKVKTPQIRIHFTWPVQFDHHLYVVYVGPKITKR